MTSDIGATGAPSFDIARLRQVMGHFCTGVAVLTGMEAGNPAGFTAQSFMSLSLDPPLVLFCPQKSSTSWPRIRHAGVFCINILSEDQEDISRAFAASGGDKFRGIGWKAAPATGMPLLHDVLAYIEVGIDQEIEGGDHTIVIGRVLGLGVGREDWPLLFYRGGYAGIGRD